MANANTLLLIICLLAIVLTTLGVNYFFHQKEQARLQRQRLMKQYQGEIERVLEALQVLQAASAPAAIRELLEGYSTDLISQLTALTPTSDLAQQLQAKKREGGGPSAPNLSSANGIQRAQAGLRNAIKILGHLQQRGKLTPPAFAEFRNELLWLHHRIEADAYVEQGKRFAASGKTALAMSHFKHAKVTISKVPTRDPRKQEKISEINKLNDEVNPFKKNKAPQPAEEQSSDVPEATAPNQPVSP
ncbi:hypothetical protein [Motiliproteus sp. SC1-56]|uniref:hypothetical protein n=1 Tax=Motiliproteus sp. SC1-56 TaxID=2799565 RepID=UPI001A8D7CCE|nr:hypothetical protein [Motiliproteus sp. SC1-56]